jgi:hypothetical protein
MLYDRVASLTVGPSGGKGREITSLRMAFSIQKGATATPNNCSLSVYNASKDTQALLAVIGNIIILKAGYAEDIGAATIFTGTISRSLTTREGPDWVTRVEMQDGLLEYRDTKVSVAYERGATALQVLRDLSGRFNLPVRQLPTGLTDRQYTNGFAFCGRLRDAMDKVCDFADLEWSIQNRQVQIIRKGGIYRQQAIVLSPDTGLIGSPEQESKTMTEKAAAKDGITANQPGVRRTTQRDEDGEIQQVLQVLGYKARTLLQPTLEPGGYVQIKSQGIDGEFFRIEELTHNGDTHAQEWQTYLTLRYTR